jgi:hypothetical protein
MTDKAHKTDHKHQLETPHVIINTGAPGAPRAEVLYVTQEELKRYNAQITSYEQRHISGAGSRRDPHARRWYSGYAQKQYEAMVAKRDVIKALLTIYE